MSYQAAGSSMRPPPTSLHLLGAYTRDSPSQNSPQRLPQQNELHNGSPQQDTPNQFALRPTHRGAFNTFSSLPPPQPQFTPSKASPLRPRSAIFKSHNRASSEPPDDVFVSRDDQSLLQKPKQPRRLRLSKSSEILRKLARSNDKEKNNQKWQPLSDEEDDEDERIRRPVVKSPRGVGGVASTISPSSPGPNTVEMIQTAPFPQPPETTQQTFDDAPSVPLPPRVAPYPATASPRKEPRPLSDYVPLRASNGVLLAAETGGMVGHEHGSYVKGKGPGESLVSPRGPRGPGPAPSPQRMQPKMRMQPKSILTNPIITNRAPGPMNSGPLSAPPVEAYPPIPIAPQRAATVKRPAHKRSHSDGEGLAALQRQGTLFHPASSQERAAKELDVMLGKPKTRRLSANRLLPAPEGPKQKDKDQVRLEAAKKGRARVELDVVIERECVVEGGDMRGRLEVVVRGGKRGKGLRVGGGKIRILGFEETDEGKVRHIFYQQQYPLREFHDNASAARCTLFTDTPDEEGFRAAKEGTHDIPFSMPLPLDGGAKGSYTSANGKGPTIRYVVVGSIKLHIPSTGKRAIAHFYRPIVVLPYHNPMTALAPSRQAVVNHVTSGLGWRLSGEKGKVEVQVALGRSNWVAGQRVWCEVAVRNQSHKKINRCALAILQTVNTWGQPKANQKNPPVDVVRTKVAEEAVEADFMDVGSGHVTSKSWWTGLEPGESNRWDMSVPIPTGMISISRSRYVEVNYTLRVTLNNTIYVDVPLRLINFLSIDPPPMPSNRRAWNYALPIPAPMSGPVPVPELVAPVPMVAGAIVSGAPADYAQVQEHDKQHARSSSTTFNIEKLIAQGRAREQAMLGDDLNPSRPLSPGSVYSTLKGKSEAGHSIDEEERNYPVAEEARRDGRQGALRVINADDVNETLLTDTEDEGEYERLSPADKGVYLPSTTPSETELAIGATPSDTDSEMGDSDLTPLASPMFSPVPDLPAFTVPDIPLFDIPDFTKHPRDEYLAHISEEEEMDDDMLSEIVSYNGDHGGHLRIEGDADDEDDDMIEEATTPTIEHRSLAPDTPSSEPRRSLEDRLANLVIKDRPLPQPASTPTTYAVLPKRHTVDYAMPIDVDTISLSGLSLDDHTERSGFDGTSSPYKRPQTVLSYSTASWSTTGDREEEEELGPPVVPRAPPRIPSLAAGIRDIRWGGALTGRTVSGRSATLQFSDDDRQLSHMSSMSTIRPESDSERESEDDLRPPTQPLDRQYTNRASSYVTADDVPPLATPENSDSDSAESPESPTPKRPVYTTPLPASPAGLPKRNSLIVPDRFRPRVVSETESHDSFTSTTSTNLTATTTESVLPAVKARVAQIETRAEALRKFSVASSAGLLNSPSSLNTPLSPTSGRVSPSGRRSYTSALGVPRARSPASFHSNTMSERSTVPGSPYSYHSKSPSLDGRSIGDRSPRSDFESPPVVDRSLGSSPRYGGLDAAALGGTAFLRGVASPTSSMGHGRWDSSGGSELSHGATRLLSRALSTNSTSTSATDVERALSPGRLTGPRGPRGARPLRAPASPAAAATGTGKALPFPPTIGTNAANTPQQLPPLFISVKSESASLDGYSSDTYSDSQGHTLATLSDSNYGHAPVLIKTMSHLSDGQFSDASDPKSANSVTSEQSNWSTGWRGAVGGLRLPQFGGH